MSFYTTPPVRFHVAVEAKHWGNTKITWPPLKRGSKPGSAAPGVARSNHHNTLHPDKHTHPKTLCIYLKTHAVVLCSVQEDSRIYLFLLQISHMATLRIGRWFTVGACLCVCFSSILGLAHHRLQCFRFSCLFLHHFLICGSSFDSTAES